MSYDVTVGDQSFNYTYNLSAFFREHMPAEGIYELNGVTGKRATALVDACLRRVSTSPHSMHRLRALYDAPNGWGSVEGATRFLMEIRDACARRPRHRVRVT